MKRAQELAARAREVALEVTEPAFGPDIRLQVEATSDAWHGTLHRHVFEQQLSVWTRIAYLDVITDGQGAIAGFVDHEAYRRADDLTTLSEQELAGIVADHEFLPPGSRVRHRTSYPGPEGGRLEAVTVEATVHGQPRRWLMEINIARRLVASIRPIDGAEAGA
jgi:hypothetical protein